MSSLDLARRVCAGEEGALDVYIDELLESGELSTAAAKHSDDPVVTQVVRNWMECKAKEHAIAKVMLARDAVREPPFNPWVRVRVAT